MSFVKSPPLFAAKNVESGEMYRARFAALSAGSEPANQEAHNFAVYEGSQPVPLGAAELLNRTFVLPLGAVLYDPVPGTKRSRTTPTSVSPHNKT